VKKLYVGNLPFSATEDSLHEFFAQGGVNPSAVNLIRDRFTGQSRGFAFVEITNDEEADRAVQYDERPELRWTQSGGERSAAPDRTQRRWWRRRPGRLRRWAWRSWRAVVAEAVAAVDAAAIEVVIAAETVATAEIAGKNSFLSSNRRGRQVRRIYPFERCAGVGLCPATALSTLPCL